MGDQSSGKSSVLEAISGIPFPRGSGLVTRCATQLSMSKGPDWSAHLQASDNNDPGGVITVHDKASIASHIEALTKDLCAGATFCHDKYIEVKIVAPDVPNLTIIDLPGIVRTATEGQSATVIQDVDALLTQYLQQKRTVVLAVIPANVDIATVDILERASKVDPGGARTMGVLTKPDLVDKGAESGVLGVLANRAKPLQHGYVMLKNRSQGDLDGAMTIEQARQAEHDWFAASKYACDGNRLGVGALTEALTELLVSQIYSALPDIRQEICVRLETFESDIMKLGTAPPDTPHGCRANAASVVRAWAESMRKVALEADYSELDGGDTMRQRLLLYERHARKKFALEVYATQPGFDGEHDRFDVEVTHSIEGRDAKIGDVLKGRMWKNAKSITQVDEEIDCRSSQGGAGATFTRGKVVRVGPPYFRGDLAARIEESRGRELPGFMNFGVFTELVREYVQRWVEPAKVFRESVLAAFHEAAASFIEKDAAYAPRLAAHLKVLATQELDKANADAVFRLDKLLKGELIPSTENHYLWDTINKIRNQRVIEKINSLCSPDGHDGLVEKAAIIAMLQSSIGDDSNESQEIQDMLDLLSAYWKLTAKRYIDEVGMTITDVFASNERIAAMESALSDAVVMAADADVQRLFKQSASHEQRRAELTSAVARMRAARQRIDEDDTMGSMGSMGLLLPPPGSWKNGGHDSSRVGGGDTGGLIESKVGSKTSVGGRVGSGMLEHGLSEDAKRALEVTEGGSGCHQ